ncbi:WYL domain-containing protein [Leptospira sp. 2 VSF19]|uniref:WYL domain-containing protein n=1 Tax=Leptospira soteropolitanensis TaxID=2950025 RepID=A0AAW5VC37_9LEPT|nr:WYL domain-containing protein [Leptospira soteropolitanensis]MCW7491778.1 WYL domain-containing protein [Leptospira soteropolitanensis]MCW7499363.1 WYL domain-containing protein [Leptospira soteropolitanensis]MCW7521046.1 WYL domain-containing protein [Leptospira soteropolitanensis]MCW7525466.1 WYL domain-containing protein [Leptospira soteropolitanensis]MCW7529333.1 WYL domain-containing protein [Leptospira soteropolitanensis]
MNPSTARAASKLNLIRLLASHPEGLGLEEIQSVTGHKSIAALKKDLGELYMIEMYPYSPTDAVDLDFDGEKVKIRLPVAVDSALPLSPKEWSFLRSLLVSQKKDGSELNRSVLSKIDSVIPSGDWSPYQRTKETIINAINEKKTLTIVYWKRDTKEKETRTLAPWLLWEENDSYLLAYDLSKKGFRSFRLDHILDITITDTEYPTLPDTAEDFLNGFKQLFGGDAENNDFAKLWITDSASYHLGLKLKLQTTGNQKQIGDTLYREFKAQIRDQNWFIQTILGYGTSVLVSEPKEIKDSILFHLQSIAPSKQNLSPLS